MIVAANRLHRMDLLFIDDQGNDPGTGHDLSRDYRLVAVEGRKDDLLDMVDLVEAGDIDFKQTALGGDEVDLALRRPLQPGRSGGPLRFHGAGLLPVQKQRSVVCQDPRTGEYLPIE